MSTPRGRHRDRQPRPPGRGGDALEWALAILLTALVVAFHLAFLTHAGGLWRDEADTVGLAGLPTLRDLAGSLRYDNFPVLVTLLVRGWLATPWGGSDQGLRALGFIIGLTVLGAMWLAVRLMRCPVPLFSLALVGLNAIALQATDSIRPHGLGIAFIIVTIGLLWRVLETPTAPRVVLACAAAVLSVQCVFQNALLLLGVGLAAIAVALWRRNARAAIAIGILGAASAASLIPYAASIRAAQAWNVVSQGPTSIQQLWSVLAGALGGGSVGRAWVWLVPVLLGCAAAVGARRAGSRAAAPASPTGSTKSRSELLLFTAAAGIAAAGVYLFTLKATKFPTQAWYYVPLMAALAPLLDAAAWAGPMTKGRRLVTLATALVIAGMMAVPGWRLVHERRTNVDLVAAELNARAIRGDLILVYPWYNGVSFQRYYRGGARWVTIPPMENSRIHRYDLLKAAMAGPDPMDPVLVAIAGSLQSGNRVWLVGGLPPVDLERPPVSLPPAPAAPTGWSNGPYVLTWGQEATTFVASHVLSSEPLPVQAGGLVSPLENLSLGFVAGWR